MVLARSTKPKGEGDDQPGKQDERGTQKENENEKTKQGKRKREIQQHDPFDSKMDFEKLLTQD